MVMMKVFQLVSFKCSKGYVEHILSIILICISLGSFTEAVRISFTKPLYNVGIYQQDQQVKKYVTHYDFQMGIKKPKEFGDINYKIRESSEIINTFEAESDLIGDFYYLRIRTKYTANINRETIGLYNVTVHGIFESSDDDKRMVECKTQVLIKVLDKNDNCPLFTREKFEFTAYENASLGSLIGQVTATDADDGINSEIFYYSDSITGQTDLRRFPFSINPFSGMIYPTRNLSDFIGDRLIGKVSAIHRGDLNLIACDTISQAQITIIVRPQNLHPPKISIKYLDKYFDPMLIDYPYAEITVSDDDDRTNSPRNPYPISITTSSQTFVHLSLVPYRKMNHYLLKLQALSTDLTINSLTAIIDAKDLGSHPRMSRTHLEISLAQFRDINLLSVPSFVSIIVPENTIVNSTVSLLRTLVMAKNSENLFKLHFSRSLNADESLSMDDLSVSSTGVVCVVKELNAESYEFRERNYSIGISLRDVTDERKLITLHVSVGDINEFPPVISKNATTVFVKENTELGENVLVIEAYDPDISHTRLTYYLYNQENLPFQLNEMSGNVLVVKDRLDAETMQRRFPIQVLVTDSGAPIPRSSVAYYEIELVDENEYKPEFLFQYCDLYISRKIDYDTNLGQYIAEDLDRDWRDKIRISIVSVSPNQPCFSINSQTGTLTLLCSLRSQSLINTANFVIELQANDTKFLSSKLVLNITVVESNSTLLNGKMTKQHCVKNNIYTRMQQNYDKMSQRIREPKRNNNQEHVSKYSSGERKRPTFEKDVPKDLHVREEMPIGYILQILTLENNKSLRDPYESQFVFGLWSQESQSVFSIKQTSPNTAEIIISDRLDRESLSKYILTVAVCDQGKPKYCTYEEITVKVEDINDNKPRFVDYFQRPLELPENYDIRKKIVQIRATDADSLNTIQYRLLNFRSIFKIHKRTGWLRLQEPLDREKQDKFQLIVVASDQSINSRSLTATLTISIIVTDVNDNKPKFAKSTYSLTLPEDLPIGSFLIQLHATDLDAGDNAQLRYQIHGLQSDCFKCNELTGTVHLLCKLSPPSVLRLTAVATDNGKPQALTGQAEFNVYPQRVQTNRYIISLKEPLFETFVKENCAPGTLVATIRPEGSDRSQKFIYTISGHSSGISAFQINSDGEIRTISNIDRERHQSFWLFVYIEDRNDDVIHKILSEIYIKVIDENDNYPMPRQAFYETSVVENLQGIHHLITISATDADINNNTILKYKIISGDSPGYFSISSTGEIFTTERSIDRESPYLKSNRVFTDFYDLKIMISDSGVPERINTVNAHINIIDINDNSPSFINKNQFSFNRYLSKETVDHHRSNNLHILIGKVTAVDIDYDLNATVRYTLLMPPEHALIHAPNNQSIIDLFSIDTKTGHLHLNISSLNFDHWQNSTIWNDYFTIKVWAFDLGIPTQWSTQPALVTVRLYQSNNAINAKSEKNKSNLFLSYQLPESFSVFYDECIGYEVLPIKVADPLDPSGVGLEVTISDPFSPFSVVWSRMSSTTSYLSEASLIVADSLINHPEKNILEITIRNSKFFLKFNVTIFIKFYNNNPPVFQNSKQDSIVITVEDHAKKPKLIYRAEASVPPLEFPSVVNATETQSDINVTDINEPLIYSIYASNDLPTVQKLFYLHSNNGGLNLISSANAYQNQTFELIIEARTKRSTYLKLIIHISDTNNMSPEFLVSREQCLWIKQILVNLTGSKTSLLSGNDRSLIRYHLEKSLIVSFVWIDGSSSIGTLVTSIAASDRDSGKNGEVVYGIKNDSFASAHFHIDPANGDIRIKQNLTPIINRVVFITVIISDCGSPVRTNQSVVAVEIRENMFLQSLPQLEKTQLDLVVFENTTVNTILHCLKLQVSFYPLTTAQFVVISTNPSTAKLFSVTRSTGCIITVSDLDREVMPNIISLEIQVQAYNGLVSKYNSIVLVKIHIADINDNVPRFVGPLKIHGVISESANQESIVFIKNDNEKLYRFVKALVIQTEDPDEGENGQIDFIMQSSAVSYFKIDPHTNVLTLKSKIDREVVGDLVSISVQLVDRGIPSLRSPEHLEILVTIEDENDSQPKFEQDFYIQHLALPTFANAPLKQIRAIDADFNSKIIYSIIGGNDDKYFTIHSETGWMTVSPDRIPLTRIIPNVLVISVLAYDGKYETRVNVTIYTYDDTKTQPLPLERTTIDWQVPENRPNVPDLILPRTKFSYFPHQTMSIRYIMLSEHPSIAVDQFAGSLKLISPLDREKQPHFSLLLLAKGVDGSYGYINVTVNVTDENDFKPLFLSDQYEFLVHINISVGVQSIKVKAIDLDAGSNGSVFYSIYSVKPYTYDVKFTIDSHTGIITVQEGPSEDLLGKRFAIGIKAHDGGQPSLSSFTTVTVDIVSDKSPLFEHNNYSVTVPEDSVKERVIITVRAASSTGHTILYTITRGNDEELFDLDFTAAYQQPGPCVIRLVGTLDYETKTRHFLVISATDPSSSLSHSTTVVINVSNCKDERPVFLDTSYTTTVSENMPVNHEIIIISTVPQKNKDNRVLFSLKDIEGSESCSSSNFNINKTTGIISVYKLLDYEKCTAHEFWVRAVYDSGSLLSSTTLMRVNIIDENDNSPTFMQQQFSTTISLDSLPNSLVLVAMATDLDSLSKLTYKIINEKKNIFKIDQSTGFIRFNPFPNFKEHISTKKGISFQVLVHDSIHSAITNISVNFIFTKNHAPVFSVKEFHITVQENTDIGTVIGNLTATDVDQDKFGVFRYEIIGGFDSQNFDLDFQTGNIVLKVSLDKELKNRYELRVCVTDGGSKHDFANVLIHVTDINDNVPIIDQSYYEVTVAIDPAVSVKKTQTILQLRARDKDQSPRYRMDYRLIYPSLQKSPVIVDAITGQMSLKPSWNRPSVNNTLNFTKVGSNLEIYRLLVQVCEEQITTYRFTNNFESCSNKVPVTINLFYQSVSQYPEIICSILSVPENNLINEIVATCRISSDLRGKWALIPGGDSSDMQTVFEIDSNYGYIRTGKIMDYEIQSQYRLNVEYRFQESPLIVTKTITIDITDQNDCSPIFDNSKYSISVSEDIPVGSRIIQYKAFDKDFDGKDIISYTIFQDNSTGTRASFRTDEQGWIFLTKPLDYETVKSYNLVISASDKADHITNASLFITIIDVNDESPYWTKNPPNDEIEIMEMCDTCKGEFPKIVYRLDARDNDLESQKDSIRFLISNQDLNPFYAYFNVSESGEIFLLRPMDAEKVTESLQLKLLASDRLHWSQEEFILTVKVVDINDHGPVCPQVQDISVPEDIKPGSVIITLQAQDRDSSANYSTLTYKLIECSDPFLLIVESKTGNVITNAPLDRESSSVINFVVESADIESRNCFFKVKMNVLDINDNEPKFTHTKIAPLLENAPLGSVVGKIHAVDIDEGINRKIVYHILDYQKTSFSIDKNTGIVKVSGLLDRERKSEHDFVVEASDCGSPAKFSQVNVKISLLDVNDSPPQFLNTPLRINVSEDTSVGSVLIRLKAISEDIGINAIVSYRIVIEQDYFLLNSTSGDLTLLKNLDFEKNRDFFLTVEASDKGSPSLSTTTVVSIQITDINDNAPQFPPQPYLFTILENSPVGKFVAKITAFDIDSEINGKIIYSFNYWLPDHTWNNKSLFNHVEYFFSLNRDTGEIFLKFIPDREEQDFYKFEVSATDQGNPPLNSKTSVVLEIEDMNDNPPIFSESSYRFIIQVDRSGIIPEGELTKNGDMFEVGRMAISDRDGSSNSKPFQCKLLNAETVSPFSIQTDHKTDDCVLLVTGSLYLGVRNLLVQVNDNGLTTLYQRVRVIIDVIRLSNIPPEIEPLNATYVYYHSSDLSKKETEIVKILVRDRSPAFDMLKYELVFNETENPQSLYLTTLFKIDSFTGVITTQEQLDSGIYTLVVKVTNGSLSSDRTIYIKVVALTKEMVESSCVIQISPMKPNIFFARRLDLKLVQFLKTAMASKLAYIISVKASSRRKNKRRKRQLVPDDIIDILIAVYNENENGFFKSGALVSRISSLETQMANVLDASFVQAFDNICNDKYICVQGYCKTNIIVNPKQPQNHFQVHGVTFSSLDFNYESSCVCAKYFGGSNCEIPLNKCAHKPCGTLRICRPDAARSPGFSCECPAFKSGIHCENVVEIENNSSCLDEQCMIRRESEPIHFTGGGFLKWNLGKKSQNLRHDISFGFRLLQKPAPLLEINWNKMRSILVDINSDGKIVIQADHKTAPPMDLYESRNSMADDKWHNIRLSVVGVTNIPDWWIHVVLDGLRPRLLSLNYWIEGDIHNQSILLGARTLVSNINSNRQSPLVLNESMTGCIKDVVLNGQRLPYQQSPSSFHTNFIKVESKNLNYGCPENLVKSVCSTGVCKNGGVCFNRNYQKEFNNSYLCQCQKMFTGKNCEKPKAPCSISPCFHGGRCINTNNDFKCLCPEGLYGSQCQWGKACSSILNPCPKYASCLEQEISSQYSIAVCRCPTSLQGYLCQYDVDECEIRPPLCQPGRGMCHNTHGGYQCNCSLGYTGRHCETDSILKINPDTLSFGLSQYQIYVIVGVLACLFVLALLTVVVLVLRLRPVGGMNSRRKRDHGTALSLDPLYQYKVYSGDQCSRYSPASSMMASSIHHPPGYVGGYMIEPPSTPGGRSQMSFHQAPPSHYGHLSQDAMDRVSLCSSTNDKRDPNVPAAIPLQNNRYIRSSRGQIYLNPAESRQRLSQHSSTFSLVPCNVGPQQHLHLVPNRNSVLFCPANNHPRLVYDSMMIRNSNLSLHSSHAASAQWEPNDNRLEESAMDMAKTVIPNINQPLVGHDITPVNGDIDHSMISWNDHYVEDGMFHREMISSQEMSLTDTTDRSTAHLLPKMTPTRINFKMQPPVIHQINISKPAILINQNGHSDSPNTVSPSSASIPSGTSSDTKGTAPDCEPRDLKKKGNKISPDSNSGEGTECDTEDLEMDHQPLRPTTFLVNKHLEEDAEDGLSSVPLLDSVI